MAGLTDTDDKGETEDSDLYTIIGAASGVLLILILSILMLTWFRRRKFDASVKYPIRSTLMKRLFKIYLKTKIENSVFLSFFNRTMPLQNRFFRTMLLTNPVEKARLSWFVFFALFLIEELPVYTLIFGWVILSIEVIFYISNYVNLIEILLGGSSEVCTSKWRIPQTTSSAGHWFRSRSFRKSHDGACSEYQRKFWLGNGCRKNYMW